MAGFLRDGIFNVVSILSMCRQTEIHMESCMPGSIYSFLYIYADRHCRTQISVIQLSSTTFDGGCSPQFPTKVLPELF